MLSDQDLIKLVSKIVPELNVDEIIPLIDANHDEILLIAEAAEELKNLEVFQAKVDSDLQFKRGLDVRNAVFNAPTVNLNNTARNANIVALEELKQRAYGKVLTVETELGELKKYRIAQANYSVIKGNNGEDIMVVNRLAPVARVLVSAEVGDECMLPMIGAVRVVSVDLLDRYSMGELDNFSLLQFWSRNLNSFSDALLNEYEPLVLENLKQKVARWRSQCIEGMARTSQLDDIRVFSEQTNASLGSSFYTRTTKVQEELLRRPPRGVVIVEGIAGSGKTSVALGRVKALHDSRIETVEEPADIFFADKTKMVGFVLHKQLVNYLEQTIVELNLGGIKVREFKELQNDLLRQRGGVLQLKMPGNPLGIFMRIPSSGHDFEYTMPWLHTIDKLIVMHYLKKVQDNLAAFGGGSWLSERLTSKNIKIDYGKLVTIAWGIAKKDFDECIGFLGSGKKTKGFYSEGLVKRLKQVYVKFFDLVSENARWYFYDDTWHLKSLENEVSRSLEPFNGRNLNREQTQWLKQFRQDIRAELRKALFLDNTHPNMPALTTWYAEILNDLNSGLEADYGQDVSAIKARLYEQKLSDTDLNLLLAIAHLMSKDNEYNDNDQTRLASYLSEPKFYSTVFIDEVQDFTEIQVFLMAEQADPKRRAVTVVGDFKQQLYPDTVRDLARCFPLASNNEKESAILGENKRQSKNLANFSAQFRSKIGGFTDSVISEPVFQKGELTRNEGDEVFLKQKVLDIIVETPGNKSIAVICPTNEHAKQLAESLHNEIQQNFRESQYSEDNRDLNKSLYVHFTVPRPTKGLEFDVVIAPYFNSYDLNDTLQANSAYVAVSRPREQLHLINLIK